MLPLPFFSLLMSGSFGPTLGRGKCTGIFPWQKANESGFTLDMKGHRCASPG